MAKCYYCDSGIKVEAHHLNWNHDDNTPGNHMHLCRRCHVEQHKVGYLNLDEMARIREKVLANKDRIYYEPIVEDPNQYKLF